VRPRRAGGAAVARLQDGRGCTARMSAGGDASASLVGLSARLRLAAWLTPVVTALAAFAIGGLVVLVTTGKNPLTTYQAIFEGSGLNWLLPGLSEASRETAAANLQQTLLITTPLILTGLAVAFAFRAGLFNIGGQGQYLVGSFVAIWVGSSLPGLDGALHIGLAIAAATLAGALWAAIAGLLKATLGAHEVVTTIMLNWIALYVGIYLFGLGGPLQDPGPPSIPVSRSVAETARLPIVWGDPLLQGLSVGIFLALATLVVYWLLLRRTTLGFRVRAVGFNSEAARYAGIGVARSMFTAMAVAGSFAGLAGALDVLGWQFRLSTTDVQITQLGFVGIAVALLGRNTAVGVGLAALLFGALTTGTSSRNLDPTVFPPELASNLALLIQGMVILFVGVDLLVVAFRRGRGALGGAASASYAAVGTRAPTTRRRRPSPGRLSATTLSDPRVVAWSGVAAAALAAWIALPPWAVRTPVPSLLLGAAAAAAGAWAARRGERRPGALAVACAVAGATLAILATQSGAEKLDTVVVWSALFAATLRFATPLVFAALGGLLSERSGVVNIGLEGMMLTGAFFAIWGAEATDSWLLGLLVGLAAGGALAAVHAVVSIHLGADQIISGTAVNILALGLTGYFFLDTYGQQGTPTDVLTVPSVSLGFLSGIPFLDAIFGDLNLLIWIAIALVPTIWLVVFHTPAGLRLRACGEQPRAAETSGVRVLPVRYTAVILSGVLAAAGGAYLSIGFLGSFGENMTVGRGFIALAALIFGRWRPFGAVGACLLFGFSSALAQRLPVYSESGAVLFQILPYVLTLVALAGLIGRSIAPAALGRPHTKH